jgi:hypothetical protein
MYQSLTLLAAGAVFCAFFLTNEANAKNYSQYGGQEPGHQSGAWGSIRVGTDQYVSWDGPLESSVWVQTDGGIPTLFARGSAGIQAAPWMERGHVYTFILKDADGNEIDRHTEDLRGI